MTNSGDSLHGLKGLQAAQGHVLEVLREQTLEVLGEQTLEALEDFVLWDKHGVAQGDLPVFSLKLIKDSHLPSQK